ncbi:fungal-specific transcription factor domain-containing protein [Aspergillus recurvatus]
METPEIGSLTAHSPQESQFVGSSSGVFFINTVRRAFGSTSREFPQPEDTLVGGEDSLHGLRSNTRASTEETPVSQWEYDPSIACVLGQAPPQQLAKDLMMVYFKVWHPLFPFLHGPTFLRAMGGLYGEGNGNADGDFEQTEAEAEPQQQPQQNKSHTSTAWTAIFQCVFHLAALITPDLPLPPPCHIQPPISSSIHTLLTPLTARHDLLSLQALLAAQLYLVATMSLRTASTVGGCMLRSMLHAGLHRCPFRYRELSASATSQHRHLRKRIFWSAYALDRYLSQALGLPLGVQDSDIDVCPPGAPEVHRPLQHLPVTGAHTRGLSEEEAAAEAERTRRETPFASYVQSGRLTGEALELFHKSIYVRSISQTSVLLLTTSVHKWWNGLDLPPAPPPAPSSSLSEKRETDETPFNYTPFFTILYHHLLLLLHRPALSLPNGTPEFLSALQSCISAARHILSALNTQKDAGQALFWPGFMSAAWMAGLVLAFACQLGQYVLAKGCAEIENCLEILGTMAGRWEPARHCQRALRVLLRAVSGGSSAGASAGSVGIGSSNDTAGTIGHGAQFRPHTSLAGEDGSSAATAQPVSATNSRKRRKVELSSAETQLQESTADQETSMESDPTGENELNTPGEMGGQDVDWGHSLGLDINMVDLLQEGNFDSLMDLFGQQYPTF